MNAAFSWGGRFKGRPGLAFTMPVCDDELRKSMLEDGTSLVRLVPLPPVLGAFLWAGQSSQLVKGATHKYIRKVPDGKGGWRYFYAVTGGKGLGHEDEVQVGSAFKLAHNGQAGHFHVTGRDANGKLTVKHDESGHTESLDPAVFVAMLHREHASAIDEHTKRLAASLKAAREHGTARHVSRLEGEAGRYAHTRHLVGGEDKPSKAGTEVAVRKPAAPAKGKTTGGRELATTRATPATKLPFGLDPNRDPIVQMGQDLMHVMGLDWYPSEASTAEIVRLHRQHFPGRYQSDAQAGHHLATARGHLEDARAKAKAGDKAGAQAEMKAAEAHAAAVRAHKEGGDTEKAAKAAEAATQAAGGPPEHKRAVPDQVTGDEQRQREEAARKSADKRRGTGKPDQGAPVAAGDVKVGERVVDGKGRTWERTSTAWRGVKPDGSPTGDVQTDKGIGRETLRRAMHNDGDRAVAVDAIHRAAGEAHARGDIEERNRLQDEAANLMPSTASGQPIPPADATPEERQAHAADFGARDHADAATHHAQAARAAEAAGNEQAADQHQAAADEHRHAAVEAIQQGQIHGPNTLALEDGKALPPHDAPKAAWDKATAGFSAADHDEAAALHRAKAFEAAGHDAATFDKDKIDQHRAAAARHAQAAEAMTTQPGSDRSASHTKLEPHERDMLRDFVENTVSHRLADLQQGLKEEQRFGGMSIYRTKNGRTFAAPTDANAHQIVQAWMKEMLHEAMPTMPDDIAEKHGFPEDDRPGVTAGMERVLARALRERATSAVVGQVQRLNNEALAALPPAKGSNGWKAMIERATQQQAGMTAGREARGAKAEKYIDGLTNKAEKTYALAVGIAIMHGGQITLPRGKAGQPAADLPNDVKMRLRREIAQAMGHSGQGAAPVEIAETRTDAPQPKSLHEAARAGMAPPVEATVGARRAQEAATQANAPAQADDSSATNTPQKKRGGKAAKAPPGKLPRDMNEAELRAEMQKRLGDHPSERVQHHVKKFGEALDNGRDGSFDGGKDLNNSTVRYHWDMAHNEAIDAERKAKGEKTAAERAAEPADAGLDWKQRSIPVGMAREIAERHEQAARDMRAAGDHKAAALYATAGRAARAVHRDSNSADAHNTYREAFKAVKDHENAQMEAGEKAYREQQAAKGQRGKGDATGAVSENAAGGDDAAHVKSQAEQAKTRHEDMHEAHVEAEKAARARGDVQAATRHRDAAEGHAVAAYHHGNVAAGHANASTGRAAMESSRANEATAKAGDPKAATAPAATQVTPPAAPDAPAQQAASAGAVAEPPSHRYTPPDGKFGTATIKADKHPVTGADTHVVTLGHRLGDQHFPVASARARELGGAYVRRVGFSFPERSAAERFAAEHQHPAQQQQPPEGMPKSRRDLAEEHMAAAKRHNAESLKAMEAGNKDLSKLHASAALAHSRAESAARTGRPDIMDHVEAAHAATKATQQASGEAPKVEAAPKSAPTMPTAPIAPGQGEATAGNVQKYESALKAAYEFAHAVKNKTDPHEAGALRGRAASMIQDFENAGTRLDYKNRPRHQQQAGALKKYLARLDEYAHGLADATHGKDGHDAEAFEKFAQGQGSRGVLESAVSGAISKSGKVLDLPGHVRQHVGNVPLEAGVKALVEATKRSGYDMAAGPKRVAHALGETGTKLSTNLHDMPLEVVQKLATGAPDSQGRYTMGDANNELAARHATASALGVPVEQVQPKHGVGTSKQALTEGIEALRDKAGSGDHRLTGDAYTELSRRDRISQAMGHGPLDELAEGGKADPVWSAPVVEHADGRRFLKRDGKWHEVGQDGRVAQFGRSRGEIEKAGRGQFRAATSSPDDMHNMTVSAMLDKIRYSGRKGASSPDWDVARELRAAVAHHNGGADGKPIKSGTGELPFEHVARASAMYDSHMADGNKLNLHEAMTDAQLKQVVGAGADHNDTHKNELEARRLGNAPLEPEKKSTTPKGGEKAVNYEQVGSMLVAKHPNGWGVWQDNGKPTEIIAGTRNEALHAAADLHERTKAGGAGGFEAARDEVKQRLENGIHARAAAVRAGRSAAGNTQAAVDALHALHAAAPKGVRTAVGDAKGNKTTKVLTPDQARRRLGTFASQEESRPNLNGYYVDPKTNTGIATDGHRLAMIPVQGHDVQGEGKTEGAIYRHQDPKGHAQSREKYAAMHEPERRDAARETWDRSYGAGSKVEVMDTQPGPTQGKQVPAAFPDYTSVIPRSGTTDYLDTDHVRQALDHADTLMRGTGTGAVTIERKNGEVLLTAHNRDSAHGPVTVKLGDTQHPDGKVAVKASYLRDTLTGAKGGTFGLTTNESLSPMLVERHDGERHVVMPMRL